MGKRDTYILSQLGVSFLFFLLVLSMVLWINHAVKLFDELISNGHSLRVFLEFMLLGLPELISRVLPIAGFAAVITVINRLSSESELVILQSTGLRIFRLAKPVFVMGLFLALFSATLTHFIEPMSASRKVQRENEVAQSLLSSQLRPGVFLSLSPTITFFAESLEDRARMSNVVVIDTSDGQDTIFLAQSALVIDAEDSLTLLLENGSIQEKQAGSDDIRFIQFETYGLEVLNAANQTKYTSKLSGLTSPNLYKKMQTAPNEATYKWYESYLHERLVAPLFAAAIVLLGFALMNLGGFSRTGIWQQILVAIGIILAIKLLDNLWMSQARSSQNFAFYYLASAIAGGLAIGLLWVADRWPFMIARLKKIFFARGSTL